MTVNKAPAQLRWDHANTTGYYHYTGQFLQPLFNNIDELTSHYTVHNPTEDDIVFISKIEEIYNNVTGVLLNGSKLYVPEIKKGCINSGGTRS